MNPLQIILAVLIAAGIPAVFLLIIYTLDLYASRSFRLVLLCFAWGGAGGIGLAYLFNTYVAIPVILPRLGLSILWLYIAFAPLAEEILKSLSLFYISRRPEFTYFVDGAIYGFAAGIGFSITENLLYMSYYPERGIALSLIRSFSVCLMHGTAAGLVGAAVGRVRFRRRSGRGLGMVGGWGAAILLHAVFNSVSQTHLVPDGLVIPLQVGLGLAGVGLIALFISLGLREERKWLAETLDQKMRVTSAEMRAAQAYGSIDEVLEPIAQQFPRKVEQVQQLLLKQAQLGIKRKVQMQIDDPKLKEQLEREVTEMQAEMNRLRKEVGLGVMTYVRSVFPDGALDLWGRMEMLAVHSGPPDVQRWASMLTQKEEAGPPARSIFGQLQAKEAESPSKGIGDA